MLFNAIRCTMIAVHGYGKSALYALNMAIKYTVG